MNRIIIKGRLTRDPELKTSNSGLELCNFCVAVDRRVQKDKQRETDFFQCVAFGKTAAAISKYMKKGREILIEGRMESSSADKDGIKVKYWNLLVDNFEFCGSKGDAPAAAPEAAPADPSGFTPVETDELPF